MTCFIAATRVECTVTFSRSNLTVALKKGIMRTPFHLSAFGNKAYVVVVVVVVVTHVPLIFSFYSLLDGNMQEDIYDR